MIYTLTLGPALDCYMTCQDFHIGKTNRAVEQKLIFGGKGVNVAVMLSRLGLPCVALGFVAGYMGEALRGYLQEEGVTDEMISLPKGQTRINLKFCMQGEETELNAPAPDIPDACMVELDKKLQTLNQGDILVLSGSIPPCLPKDTYARIMHRLQGSGVDVVVDAEGECLLSTLPYRPLFIKPNLPELSSISGREMEGFSNMEDIQTAAQALQAMGAQNVLVSMGRDGALMLTKEGACIYQAAVSVDVVQTVGAGDAMVAGFIKGLSHGYTEALRYGIAAGCATASTWGMAPSAKVLEIFQGLDS